MVDAGDSARGAALAKGGLTVGSSRQDGYRRCGALTGAVPVQRSHEVRFVQTVTGRSRRDLVALVAVCSLAQLCYLGWLVAPSHWPGLATAPQVAGTAALVVILVIELVRLTQAVAMSVFALVARDPVPMALPSGVRVALLTTIVPSCESVDMLARTLAAMRGIRCGDCPVDVWVLDEGGAQEVRELAGALGVRYFSRHGRADLNTPSGRYRRRTKSGNHNAWLTVHGDGYDVVGQMDPDHVPGPHFLDRTLGYFDDPDVAFVVAPQVYGDAPGGYVARGAAAQAYLFHGVVQRGGNGLRAPLLIGTNHCYRVTAWQQVGGYQESIIEDHLTSMTVHAAVNPATLHRWKGVYTPDVIAIGQAPATWGDLLTQQRRWSHGVADIVLRQSPRLLRHLAPGQRLAYLLLQSFYPGLALTWLLGVAVSGAYLLGVPQPLSQSPVRWALLWCCSLGTTAFLLLWLRRCNVAHHERTDSVLPGLVVTLCMSPVYLASLLSAVLRRPLEYQVTPKGLPSTAQAGRRFLSHGVWALVLTAVLVVGSRPTDAPVPTAWAVLALVVCLTPPVMHLVEVRRGGPAASASRGRHVEHLHGRGAVAAGAVPADDVQRVADRCRAQPRASTAQGCRRLAVRIRQALDLGGEPVRRLAAQDAGAPVGPPHPGNTLAG